MRKKILTITFLISVIMLGLSYHFNNTTKETYNLESDSICLSTTQPNSEVSYKVSHYFPNLDGTYEVETENFTGTVGEIVTSNSKSVVGFSFDSTNQNNILTGTLTDDTDLELKIYYERRKFLVYLKNNTSTYGDLTLEDGTPISSSITILFEQSIYVDGDVLVVGDYRIVGKPIAADTQYEYSFVGWDLSALSLDSDGKFTIVNEYSNKFDIGCSFDRTVRKYTISWMNENSLIYSEKLPYGEFPSYKGEIPTKDKEQQYTYSFVGWNPEVKEVTGDVTYFAQYSSKVNYYKVYFEIIDNKLNYGSLSISGNGFEVPYGTTISINPKEPNKISIGSTTIIAKPSNNTSQYEYSFEYWDYDSSESSVVQKDITIYAKFQRAEKSYTILWMNEDRLIYGETLKYGTLPVYTEKNPVKSSTAEFSYNFVGWSPRISTVTKNVNYYAQFEEIRRCYTVSWMVNGVVIETDVDVPYGTIPEFNGETPSLAGGDGYYFIFEGWDYKVSEVTKDVTYQAVFSKWYVKNTVDNDNRISLNSSGLRSEIIFKAEELKENRIFVLPKDMEVVVIYKASLTKQNEAYVSEEPFQIIVDLKSKYDSSRVYHVYMNIDGEIVEPELTVEGSCISFYANEVGSFVVYTEIVKNVNLVWLMIILSVLIVAEASIFYFIVIKKYRQYKRQIELNNVNSNVILGLLLVIRIVTAGQLVPVILLGVLFLSATGFLIYCYLKIKQMKKLIPDEEEDFIYIPVHSEEESDIETCPIYTGPKRDFSKAAKQTYYDTPYRPIYYYQPIPIYQQGPMNVENDDEVNDDDIIIEDGEIVRVHFKRSFMSKIIQGSKEIQDYYTKLRNEISAYSKLKSRLGWEHESIYTARETIVLIKVKNDTLCVFLALDPSKYNKSKYNFGDVGKIKKYKNVPMLIKILDEKDLENVIKLLEQICKKNKLVKEQAGNEDYHYEFRTDRELIDEGLIKEIKTYSKPLEEEEQGEILTEDMIRSQINVSEAKEALTDEQALSLIETVESTEKQVGNKKTIVNIGTLSRFYEANEVVNLESLKSKKIVSKDTGYVKILASGVLDKPLIVEANGYSIDAVKMILLTGGKVTKI